MNKKFVCTAMAAMLLCSLTACGGDSSSSSTAGSTADSSSSAAATQAGTDAAQSSAADSSSSQSGATQISFDYIAKGQTIVVGEPADDIIKAMGPYDKMFVAPSCAYTGSSNYYTFGGLQVVTYPDEHDQTLNRIYEVDLLDDTVATNEGIKIGDKYDDVVAKYGKPDQETAVFAMYKSDGKAVQFFFDKANPDVIKEIVYTIVIN